MEVNESVLNLVILPVKNESSIVCVCGGEHLAICAIMCAICVIVCPPTVHLGPIIHLEIDGWKRYHTLDTRCCCT